MGRICTYFLIIIIHKMRATECLRRYPSLIWSCKVIRFHSTKEYFSSFSLFDNRNWSFTIDWILPILFGENISLSLSRISSISPAGMSEFYALHWFDRLFSLRVTTPRRPQSLDPYPTLAVFSSSNAPPSSSFFSPPPPIPNTAVCVFFLASSLSNLSRSPPFLCPL